MNRIILLLCLSSPVLGQTQVPNIFEDGSPALADEVNENFDALLSGIHVLEGKVEQLEEGALYQSCSDESMSGKWSIVIGADPSESALCLAYFDGSTWLADQSSCTNYVNDGSQETVKPQSGNFSVDSNCKVTILLSSGDGSSEIGSGWMSKGGSTFNGITQNSVDNIVLTWSGIKLD